MIKLGSALLKLEASTKKNHIRAVYFRTKKPTTRYIWKGDLETATCRMYHLPTLLATCMHVWEGEAHAPDLPQGQVGSSGGGSAM